MADRIDQAADSGSEATISAVLVPEYLHEKVVDYVKQVMEADADTSAYMLGLGGAKFLGTKCSYVASGGGQKDIACGDFQ